MDHESEGIVHNDRFFFSSFFEGRGTELAEYDGTSVRLAADVDRRSGSFPLQFTIIDGLLYFTTRGFSTQNDLWVYDGSDAHRVGKFWVEGVIDSVTEFHDLVYFDAPDFRSEVGWELWVTDGTEGYFELVADINPGRRSSGPHPYPFYAGLPRNDPYPVFNDKLWFYANDDPQFDVPVQPKLWNYDGKKLSEGSDELKVWKGSGFIPQIVALIDGNLFYWAENEQREVWLYQNDGTIARPLINENAAPLKEDGTRDYASARTMNYFHELFDGELHFIWQNGLWKIAGWPSYARSDLNRDGVSDVKDIDFLSAQIRAATTDLTLDLNTDQAVDAQDREVWVTGLIGTYFGDADLDGEFNSSDLVAVFKAGEYEDPIAGNSTWSEGDWDGDGDFTTGDLTLAFRNGGYEQGPRSAVNGVPEPTTALMVLVGAVVLATSHRPIRAVRARSHHGFTGHMLQRVS